ncbi:golgin subfamily A member 2 [Pectinophora gossypiella]|nr:golgin subfamily A member 2 [Pectinophora gossypiella]XP_049865891.1 golgin subfamily A member 2 [Pectinophora gossypiella]
MDARAAKLALARQKLKSHQEKKLVSVPKEETSDGLHQNDIQSEAITNDTIDSVNVSKPAYETNPVEQSNPNMSYSKESNNNQSSQEADVNVTEILISSKRNLEIQVYDLQTKFTQLENEYTLAINNNKYYKQQISQLENELKSIQSKYLLITEKVTSKEKIITELNTIKSSICDENNNLQEQLEFTKTMLTSKESENASLHNQVCNLQHELDATQLQLQQLTNGSIAQVTQQAMQQEARANTEALLQKIANLEQQLIKLQKEREQNISHYEHYVGELNEQLKSTVTKNHELSVEVQNLSLREHNLIEQISDMEIRLQHMRQHAPCEVQPDKDNSNEIIELQDKYDTLQAHFEDLSKSHEELQKKYTEIEIKLKELNEANEPECGHDNISLSKLNADIASDKLAAQRATEQNKKLKTDLQELEEAFVKISTDKLELTEKVAAEKFLNRELTIKLAEIEEKAKDMHTKLLAKDEEMIRLQNSYRELERKINNIPEVVNTDSRRVSDSIRGNDVNHENCSHGHNTCEKVTADDHHFHKVEDNHDSHSHNDADEHKCLIERNENDKGIKIPKEDAMLKLQDRFLKIMEEVADLSDEKHRLEHIILQLQNETDTICEYVALYQQQRSLLKKRDEERSAQIKIFQTECDLLKSQLEELSGIIIRLAQDTELATYFQVEPRQSDLTKVMNLLSKLKNNTLVDPHRISSELKDFYPCSCCSGKLIDV